MQCCLSSLKKERNFKIQFNVLEMWKHKRLIHKTWVTTFRNAERHNLDYSIVQSVIETTTYLRYTAERGVTAWEWENWWRYWWWSDSFWLPRLGLLTRTATLNTTWLDPETLTSHPTHPVLLLQLLWLWGPLSAWHFWETDTSLVRRRHSAWVSLT